MNPPPPPSARGFSLVELLVAMTLGLVLLAGMVSVFAGNRRSSELNEAMTQMQENVRFALNDISADIRMAGHQGCADPQAGSVRVVAKDVPMTDPGRGLGGTAVFGAVVESATNWDPSLPYGAAGSPGAFAIPTAVDAVPGTHVLALQFGDARTGRLNRQVGVAAPSPSGTVRLEGDDLEHELDVGALAIISDCMSGDLFRVSGSSVGSAGNLNLKHAGSHNVRGDFQVAYGQNGTIPQVRVMPFRSNVYFVGDTDLENGSGDPIRALYQQSMPFGDAGNPPTELVQGVENLRLSFGIRDADDTLRYVEPGDAAFDPAAVRAVRIGLLMSSWDRIAQQEDERTYVLAGQPVASGDTNDGLTHAGDRRFRLAFNTTVKVRNFRDNEL